MRTIEFLETLKVKKDDFSNPLKVIKENQKIMSNTVNKMFKREKRGLLKIYGGDIYEMIYNLGEMQSAIMRIVPCVLYLCGTYEDVGKGIKSEEKHKESTGRCI